MLAGQLEGRAKVVLRRIAFLGLLAAGCTTATPQASTLPTPSATAPTVAATATAAAGFSPEPTVVDGFVFAAEDVVAYYQSIGYTCEPGRPSTQAAGYTVTPCRFVDADGRTRIVGIVTDTAGLLGNGYAGVWGSDAETYLDPATALDPLAAFLGTMLGAERGAEAAIWVKEHLGEAYARTMVGSISVATYTGADDDPSELYVEVADDAYLAASPAPSSTGGS
jgi:hypothetical protein